MGDTYEDDEGRLMIDDTSESTHASQNSTVSQCTTEISGKCAFEKNTEFFSTSEDKASNVRAEKTTKEEGELDDEEDTLGATGVQTGQSGATNAHHPVIWSGSRSGNVDPLACGGARKGRAVVGQQFDQQPARLIPSQLPHPSTHTHSDSQPKPTNLEKQDAHGLPATVTSLSKIMAPTASARAARVSNIQNIAPVSERANNDSSQRVKQTNLPHTEANEICNPHSAVAAKSRKKKRRMSEKDEPNACQASSSDNAAGCVASSQSTVSNRNKRRRTNTKDRSTGVCVKAVQTCDGDMSVGAELCLNVSVLAKVSNYLYFATNWNGRELFGVIGDGLPPMHHTCMNKRNGNNLNAMNSIPAFDLGGLNDRLNGSPQKQRPNAKRNSRSSSVCPANGLPDNKLTARKGLGGNVARPSSASISDVQSVAGTDILQDDDGSQSPVLWNNTLNCDSISVLPLLPSNVQIGERTAEPMYSCPIGGCGHRYAMLSQLAIHYHDHFVNPGGGRAIYVETMGSQTERVETKDTATDPVNISTADVGTMFVPENITSVKESSPLKVEAGTPGAPLTPKSTTKLTNTEEESISELFKVVNQKAESSTTKADLRKISAPKYQPIVGTDKAYGQLFTGGETSSGETTALDAIRKMVASSGTETMRPSQTSHEHAEHKSTVIAAVASLPSTSVAVVTSHQGAASPAFSDISDDAPTLEKEVGDRAEEREQPKKSPLGQLSLTIDSEKVPPSKDTTLDPSSLLCPSTAATTVPTLSVSRLSVETGHRGSTPTSEVSKKSEVKTTNPPGTSGSYASPFLDPSAFPQGLRPPVCLANFPNIQNPGVYGQPYFMPYISPSTSSAAGLPMQSSNKHKIHDLKTPNTPGSLPKDSGTVGHSPAVIASPSSRPVSRGTSNIAPPKLPGRRSTPNAASSSASTSNALTLQTHSTSAADRNLAAQTAQAQAASTMNFVQQQQQAFLAQLPYAQQIHYMQRFGGYPLMNPNPQHAFDQMATFQAMSLGFPGMFAPPQPPK